MCEIWDISDFAKKFVRFLKISTFPEVCTILENVNFLNIIVIWYFCVIWQYQLFTEIQYTRDRLQTERYNGRYISGWMGGSGDITPPDIRGVMSPKPIPPTTQM